VCNEMMMGVRYWERIQRETIMACFKVLSQYTPILVAARSKAWVCGPSLAGIAGSNPAGGMDACLL